MTEKGVIRNFLEQSFQSTWFNVLFTVVVCVDTLCIAFEASEYVPAMEGTATIIAIECSWCINY